MKRKIGELRSIPIVEGDKNLVKKGVEIHINDMNNGSSSGTTNEKEVVYYRYNVLNISSDIRSLGRMVVSALKGVSFITDEGKMYRLPGVYQSHHTSNGDAQNPVYSIDTLLFDIDKYATTIIAIAVEKSGACYINIDELPEQFVINYNDGVRGIVLEFINMYKAIGIPAEEAEEMILSVYDCFTPITKEEYESLITQ